MQSTFLVTGAAGMLGSEVVSRLCLKHKVIAVYHNRALRFSHENVTPLKLDLTDSISVRETLGVISFDAVVHCAASINLEFCESHFEDAVKTNVFATKYLVDTLKAKSLPNKKFIFISSDAVYPDVDGNKSETVLPNPLNIYGMTKLWSEQVVAASGIPFLVFRTTVVGPEDNQFFGWILKSGLEKKPLRLFDDVVFTPISVRQVSQVIQKAFEQDVRGVFNLCNTEGISKAKFAEKILNKVSPDCPRSLASLRSIDSPVHRSFNMCMSPIALEKTLNQKMPTIQETIADVFSHIEELKKNGPAK